MKILMISIWILACSSSAFTQGNIYQLSFPGIGGSTITMSSYTGKKIVVAVCSFSAPNLQQLKSLDSLSKNRAGNISVILIPVRDFDSLAIPAGTQDMQQLLANGLQLSYIVAAPSMGKKASGGTQHPLLQWATNKGQNGHFDVDVEQLWQIFVLGGKGNLYAVMQGKNDLTGENMNNVLNAQAPTN